MNKIYNITFLFILLNLYINENNFIRNELINEKNHNLRNGSIYNNDKILSKNEVDTNIESNENSIHEYGHNIEGEEVSKANQEQPNVEDITYKKKDVADSEIPFSGSDIQGTYQFRPTPGRITNPRTGGNTVIPPPRRLSGLEGVSYPFVFTSSNQPRPQRANIGGISHLSGIRGIHTYSGESGENQHIVTSRSNTQNGANDLTGTTQEITQGEQASSETNRNPTSGSNSTTTSLNNNILGWEFGGGAPQNGAAEDKKTNHLLEQIKIPSWDRDNIPDENEQVIEDPQEDNKNDEEETETETENLETEEDNNEEIEENEEDDIDEEIVEENEEDDINEESVEEKEEKTENKITNEGKEEQKNNSPSDINAQNLISNKHKKNDETKKTAENIVKTLVGLFSEKNQIDSTINNLVQEMIHLFSNN
ncbi:merozoite surface protein 6 [Plasmodium reichenowi]|uniref:Merozoite surface protein 6 n=2 Tax=Plasmodium reichenowi TaxID=5854 RepID=A0A2P9DG34_PLARE|nr:merozoite surface protein 6 [Plasmodium reichenowi]